MRLPILLIMQHRHFLNPFVKRDIGPTPLPVTDRDSVAHQKVWLIGKLVVLTFQVASINRIRPPNRNTKMSEYVLDRFCLALVISTSVSEQRACRMRSAITRHDSRVACPPKLLPTADAHTDNPPRQSQATQIAHVMVGRLPFVLLSEAYTRLAPACHQAPPRGIRCCHRCTCACVSMLHGSRRQRYVYHTRRRTGPVQKPGLRRAHCEVNGRCAVLCCPNTDCKAACLPSRIR